MAQRTSGDATVAATPAQAGPSSSAVEARLREAASELLAAHPRPLRTPARAAENRAMGALAERPAVRAALFRLVDVAPACRNDSELAIELLFPADRTTTEALTALTSDGPPAQDPRTRGN